MKKNFLIILCVILNSAVAQVPYPVIPDWESDPLGHVATGLSLADINGDGWKDMIVANGNDISRQSLVVYYNNGDGSFPSVPSWSSADVDYHGHCAAGDLDRDGDIDVAVSVYLGPSGFSSPGELKVYYNTGTELESTPSFISDPFYTFSCALGDADGDGDLDIAAAPGEPYSEIEDFGKIFINNNGTFNTTAEWQSDNMMGALDVEFGDINRDGFMDVIFVCQRTDNYIYLADGAGAIQTSFSWHSGETDEFINSVDIGYLAEPAGAQVVMTENDQLGGTGRVRMYDFTGGVPASSTADWYSTPKGFGSGITLYDVSSDGYHDLIYGGWWLPAEVFLADGSGSFQTPASWTSMTSSVVEAILIADLGKESWLENTETFNISTDMEGTNFLVLSKQVVEEIITVRINGDLLDITEYSSIPGKPWILFSSGLTTGDVVTVTYNWSPHGDMVISNWDSGKGNYVFYNQNIPIGLTENYLQEPNIKIFPNPAKSAIRVISSGYDELQVFNISGKELMIEAVFGRQEVFLDISGLKSGCYILKARRTDGGFEHGIFFKEE